MRRSNVSNPIDEGHYTEDEVCADLRVKKRTTRIWRQKRVGPPWVKPTRNLIIYPKKLYREWLEAETVLPLSMAARRKRGAT
jgi:hypothetical protein